MRYLKNLVCGNIEWISLVEFLNVPSIVIFSAVSGMGKEVENLITENTELMATK